jgi:copper oxidase (laccase) domain-containing protein
MVWFGPAIGPEVYEVGSDVMRAFSEGNVRESAAFSPHGEKWLLDLYTAARIRLKQCGIDSVFGGGHCTFTDKERFFSFRRDGVTGRMASFIWME